MGISRIKLGFGLTAVLLSVAAPALAAPDAIGIPDAPPVERVVSRHDGFELPGGFETSNGQHFPGGVYDLALIERGGRYYLQLTHRGTHRGVRVSVRAKAPATAPAAGRSLHFGMAPGSIRLTVGELATTFPLADPRKAS